MCTAFNFFYPYVNRLYVVRVQQRVVNIDDTKLAAVYTKISSLQFRGDILLQDLKRSRERGKSDTPVLKKLKTAHKNLADLHSGLKQLQDNSSGRVIPPQLNPPELYSVENNQLPQTGAIPQDPYAPIGTRVPNLSAPSQSEILDYAHGSLTPSFIPTLQGRDSSWSNVNNSARPRTSAHGTDITHPAHNFTSSQFYSPHPSAHSSPSYSSPSYPPSSYRSASYPPPLYPPPSHSSHPSLAYASISQLPLPHAYPVIHPSEAIPPATLHHSFPSSQSSFPNYSRQAIPDNHMMNSLSDSHYTSSAGEHLNRNLNLQYYPGQAFL